MPDTTDTRYTLTELADLAGVTPRTVRYYISQGLLPSDATPGPGAKYGEAHLARLRLIKRLQRGHQPLAEIRHQLEAIDDADVLAMSEAAPEPPTESALDYVRRVMSSSTRAAEPPAEYAVHRALASMAMPAELARSRLEETSEPPPRIERSQWEHISLAPDIELHIRRPLARPTAKRVDRLIEIARDLFQEEPQ